MRLTRLEIHQLPGMPAVTVDGFAPGVNFIVGANAIGKSSLVRALHSVLVQPDSRLAAAIAVAAEFEADGHHWRADRTGPLVDWHCDGQRTDPPPLPAAEALHCYWLSAQSLLAPRDADQVELSRRLRQALAGGIDLATVRQAAGFERKGFPRGLYDDLEASRAARRTQESAYRQLEAARHRLPERRAALTQAREAQSSVQRLEAALAVAKYHQTRAEIDRALAEFPAAVQTMKGDEAERADELAGAIAAAEKDLAHAEIARQQQARRLEETGLAGGTPPRALLETLRLEVQQLREAEQALETASTALARATATEAEALEDLGGPAPTDLRVTPGLIDELEEAIRERDHALGQLTARQADTTTRPTRPPMPLLASPMLGGGVAILGGLITPSLTAIVGGIIALLGGGLIALWPRWADRGDHTAGVEAAQTKVDATQAVVDQLLTQQGIQPDSHGASGVLRLLSVTRRVDQARDARVAADAEKQATEQRVDARRDALITRLAAWTHVSEQDTHSLQAAVEDLATRTDEATEILRAQRTAAERGQAAQDTLEQTRRRQAQFYKTLDLDPGDRAGIDHRLTQHATYMAQLEQANELKAREAERADALQSDRERLAQAYANETEALQSALDDARDQASAVDTLQDEVAGIEAQLSQTGSDDALAAAIAEEQTLTESLRKAREAHQTQCLGEWLLSEVETAYRERHEPALIEEARQRFEQFTQHEWSLMVDEDHELLARDLRDGTRRPLDQLSAGTRMQLLLAARIAWAKDQERQTVKLPIALDETLNATDPVRFRAAVQSLEQLARDEGRQILYLTARPEDQQLWESATGQTVHRIDLQALLQPVPFQPAEATPAPLPTLPAPGDDPPTVYARRLGVPAIDPRHEAGELHLFHLLRDHLETLHALIATWGIERLGPAERWLKSPAGLEVARTTDWPTTLSSRILMARTWLTLAHQGLGRPVGPEAITASDTQSAPMAAKIARTAQACNGEGDKLIDALRQGDVPNLQRTRIDALAQWLTEHGYIDPRAPMDAQSMAAELAGQYGHRYGPEAPRQLAAWLAEGAGRA